MSDTSNPFAGMDPASSAIIQQMLAGLGTSGDTNTLGAVWGNSMSTDTVVQSRKSPSRVPPKGSTPYLYGGAPAQSGEDFRKNYSNSYTDQTASEIFNEIYGISQNDPTNWRDIQQQLYLGGFYGNKDLAEISFGQPDDDDVNAINQVLTWTARHNAADKAKGGKGDTDWRTILSGYAKELIGPRMEQLAKAARRGSGTTVSLADPAGLAQGLDEMAKNVLGRKATSDEKKLFISTFHAMQSGAQSAEGGTVVNPDAQGQAEQLLRQQNPAEAGAHDMANTFNDFLQILSGGFS